MAAAAGKQFVVAEEAAVVTSITSSSTVDGTTTTITSTSRIGRLWGGWGGNGPNGEAAGSEATTATKEEEEEEVITSYSAASSHSGGGGSKRRTLSFLGHAASGITPLGLQSERHKEAFEELKAKIAAEAPKDDVEPFNSDDYVNRVLVARNLDVDAAFKMWQGIVAWRQEYKPDQLSEVEAAPYLAQGVISRCGPDKRGHPCLYAMSKNHLIDSENHERNLRTIVHMLDATKTEATERGNGFIAVIIDQDQCGRKNMDTHLFIGRPGLVHILQDFYPETLAAAYIMHTSWLFRAVWAIVSPFLDEKTRSKVKVLAKTEDILEHFDVEVLPPSLQEKLGYTPGGAKTATA